MTDHEFGGEHTELKLEVIGSYLQRFNTVLKNQNFERVYIDAFAGAGKDSLQNQTIYLEKLDNFSPVPLK